MRLRVKLAAALAASAGLAGVLVTAGFLRLQERAFLRSQSEERGIILEAAGRAAKEASFAQDPLMLLDHLRSTLAAHPEALWAEAATGDKILRVEASPPREEADPIVESASPPEDEAGTTVRVAFSRKALDAESGHWRRRAVRDAVLALGLTAPFALLLAAWYSGRLAGRLEALGDTLDALGEGRFGARTAVGGKDEIGKLAGRLNEVSDKLAELEGMKKTFIASVTNELRSPIAAIESGVRLLLTSEGRPQAEADMLRRIEANASRLGHFVTNLLDMAKIERGRLELHPRRVDPHPLFEDAVAFFSPKAQESGVTLTCASRNGLPPQVRLDPDLVTQVLSNLISNAIKFTPRGGTVTVEVRGVAEGGKPWLEGSVRDSGPGIPKEVQARLFAPFEQGPARSKTPGTGLGLAISKSIVELHGGTIGVESAPGQGARFYFKIPASS